MDLQAIIDKAHREWKADPIKAQEEIEVISNYGEMFNPKNIDNLTADNFRSFLTFRNNKHWTGLGLLGPESEPAPDPTTNNPVWCELVQGGEWLSIDGKGHCLEGFP